MRDSYRESIRFHLAGVLAILGLVGTLRTESQAAGPVPKALIIGDSISVGYTPYVVQQLKGRIDVVHNKGNGQHSGYARHNRVRDRKSNGCIGSGNRAICGDLQRS